MPLAESINTELPNISHTEQVNPIDIDTNQAPIQISTPPISGTTLPVQIPTDNVANGEDSFFVQDGDSVSQERNRNREIATANAVRYMHNKDKLLIQGTYLRCILETKIISEIPGFYFLRYYRTRLFC